ncbi:bZIP transcription factor 53-like [Panicum miliaceum]|uniref:BZIP transcription factor 53-like n=1 Tax=Panicum miliaceum TaxID=4540 RepID=A0A3L6TJ48_PANMI|nr:bZIP transcription factor 53-like [Panicum miliaceum]
MVAAAAAPQGAPRAAVATEEERRRNRMTSNRLSARKSRMKRQQHVDDLTAEAERLRRENEAMRAGAGEALRRGRALEQENRVLAAHARQLCAALLQRNSQLRLLGGVPLDVPGVPDHLVQLYGGPHQMPVMPLAPPPPLQLPLEIQMLLQPDVMDAVGMLV